MDAERAQGAATGEVHWSYEGDTGPYQWGGLDSSFAVCDSGAQQSPIDLTDAIPAGGGGLEIQWQPAAGEVVDNGHTIQVNIDAGKFHHSAGPAILALAVPVPSIYSSASPWVGSQPCGAKYPGFCADSKGV